jgi:signal peptidase I
MTTRRLALRVGRAVLNAVALLAALLCAAVVTGQLGIVSTYGVSMNPVYYQGDLVVVERANEYSTGDIVAYPVPGKDIVALHRIIRGDADTGFVLKGDNNPSVDPTQPTSAEILGRAVLHLPHAGDWLKALTSPYALAAVACALIIAGGAARTRRTNARRRRRAAMSRHTTRTRLAASASTPSLSAMPPASRAALAAAGTVGLVAVALGAFAWTAPTHAPAGTTTNTAQQLDFSYSATVPLTAAYDDTTVTAPEPVFRRLTNTVDVQLAYRGGPGTLSVDAELSTRGGWRATIPLAEPATFTGDSYDTSVTLDLDALEARADAAAEVTGIAADQLTVTIAPTITAADGSEFAPTLPLELSSLQLTLTGGAAALAATQTTPLVSTIAVPRMLGIAGVQLEVATARALSLGLLVAAALAAAAGLWSARRTPPLSRGAQIRRRYAPLIATVAPMTTPSHLPVMEVAEFGTLAKLAQRYGLLVMHWTRSDVDTFIVLDEAATYRFRCGGDLLPDTPELDADQAADATLDGHPAGNPTA